MVRDEEMCSEMNSSRDVKRHQKRLKSTYPHIRLLRHEPPDNQATHKATSTMHKATGNEQQPNLLDWQQVACALQKTLSGATSAERYKGACPGVPGCNACNTDGRHGMYHEYG